MEQIDWSKAPTDATHWEPETDEVFASWMKRHDEKWYYWKNDEWLFHSSEISASRIVAMIPRPAEQATWSGTGLPPIGTVCEANFNGGWRRVEVFAHKREGDTVDVLFTHTKDSGADGWYWLKDAARFRPIRTPEKIAAEERERACDVIYGILRKAERPGNLSDMAEALYDAGYRKTAN